MMNTLKIEDLKLAIYLGWEEAERQTLQTIDISLKLMPSQPFKAMETDDLKDSICYQTIEDTLTFYFKHQTFRLIEHFAYCCYEKILTLIPDNTALSLTVTKHLDEVRGTRSFTLTTLGGS